MWRDDFDGPAGAPPSAAHWTAELGGGGWGDEQLQTYTDANAALDGEGRLAIVARREEDGTITSARLHSKGKVHARHARVEAGIRVPRARGVWPAFWMLGTDIRPVRGDHARRCARLAVRPRLLPGAQPRRRRQLAPQRDRRSVLARHHARRVGARDLTSRRRQVAAVAREAARLRGVPPRVVAFYARAWLTALRTRDRFTLDSASRPSDVAPLLALARGHRTAVELGTGTAWTTVALALADPQRRVVSYDPVARPERERYLALAGAARERIVLHALPAEAASPAPGSVGFLFIDCAHDRETTAAAFRAWEAAVAPGGVAAFHDYDHPVYPGVREAVEELGLKGRPEGGLFVWRRP